MIPILKTFKFRGFVKNVLTLTTGSTIAQAIPIAISPILTRLYTPEDFGILALFLAIVSFIAIVITGQYESAVMLPEKDEDAVNIVVLALIITFVISLIILLIVWIFNKPITNLLDNQEISNWLYFIPLVLILTGMYKTFNIWLTRKKHFKYIAVSRVSQTAGNSGIKLGIGLMNAGPTGLISGAIGGQLVGTSVLSWQVWKKYKDKMKLLSLRRIKENFIKYQDFPKYNAPQGFLDMINQNGIIFIITAFFSITSLGFYSFSMNILKKPLTLIGFSISQVFYQKASEKYKEGKNIWIITKKIIVNLTLIALPISAVLILWGPSLFSFVFGNNWRDAGVYAQILAPWILINFIGSPISTIPLILNKQKQFLVIGIGYNLLLPVIFLLFSYVKFDIYMSLIAVSITGMAYTFGKIIWIRNISK